MAQPSTCCLATVKLHFCGASCLLPEPCWGAVACLCLRLPLMVPSHPASMLLHPVCLSHATLFAADSPVISMACYKCKVLAMMQV